MFIILFFLVAFLILSDLPNLNQKDTPYTNHRQQTSSIEPVLSPPTAPIEHRPIDPIRIPVRARRNREDATLPIEDIAQDLDIGLIAVEESITTKEEKEKETETVYIERIVERIVEREHDDPAPSSLEDTSTQTDVLIQSDAETQSSVSQYDAMTQMLIEQIDQDLQFAPSQFSYQVQASAQITDEETQTYAETGDNASQTHVISINAQHVQTDTTMHDGASQTETETYDVATQNVVVLSHAHIQHAPKKLDLCSRNISVNIIKDQEEPFDYDRMPITESIQMRSNQHHVPIQESVILEEPIEESVKLERPPRLLPFDITFSDEEELVRENRSNSFEVIKSKQSSSLEVFEELKQSSRIQSIKIIPKKESSESFEDLNESKSVRSVRSMRSIQSIHSDDENA